MLALSDVQKWYDFKEQHKQASGKVYVGCELVDGIDVKIHELQAICKEIMLIHKQLCIQVNDKQQVYLMDVDKLNFDDFVFNSDINADINDDSVVNFLISGKPITGQNNVPLWRLIYFEKTNYLVFNFSHCFYDGMAAVNVLKVILDRLNKKPVKQVNYSQFEDHVVDKALLAYGIVDVFPRPIYGYFNYFKTFQNKIFESIAEPLIFNLIKKFPKVLNFNFFKKFNRLHDPHVSPIIGKFVDSHYSIRISPINTKKLITISKSFNTTLNTLLITLLAISCPGVNTANFSIPINLRTHLFKDDMREVGSELIALAISSAEVTAPLFNLDDVLDNDQINIAELQRTINEFDPVIRQGITDAIANNTIATASYYKDDFNKLLATSPKGDFELSNLGLFKHDLIKDVVFNQGLEPVGYMNASAIGGISGTNINFMWHHSINDLSRQRVVMFEKLINTLCNQPIEGI